MMVLALALACAPKATAPVEQAAAATTSELRSTKPAPLEPRAFTIPTPVEATLANGIPVVVVENHEAPLVYVRLVFRAGAASDPKAGLASVTLDMMNEGVKGLDAEALSAALKKLATDLGASAATDASDVGMSCLKKNLEPSLDLMAKVTKEPTFPKAEWTIVQKRRLQDLESARDNPESIANRVLDAVTYSHGYMGNLPTAKDYQSMTTAQMKAWYDQYLVPENALLLVGGDVTLAEIQPLLESRFGTWKKKGKSPPKPDPALKHLESKPTVYLVDKAGAPQSVIKVATFVGDRSDRSAYYAKKVADVAMAGMFTSRVNLNLREDKGYTYGASGWTYYDALAGRYVVGAGVRTDATVPALKELLNEMSAPMGAKAFATTELDDARGYWLGTYPLRFESPGFLLDQMAEMWLYSLPDDWVTAMPGGIRWVNVDAMNQVWKDQVKPDQLTIVVVGDKATIGPSLAELGYTIVDVDPDGNPVKI